MPTAVSTTAATEPLPERDVSLNLQQRMLMVMHRIGYIPKEGTGPEAMGSYKFARVEHVKDAVREECVRAGVMVHVSLDGRDVQLIDGTARDGQARRSVLATVWGTMAFVNVDVPEDREAVSIHGQGIDTQDKAISKATTSAVKYGLINAFTIPTGDDPDAEGHDLPAGGAQARPQRAQTAPQSRGGDEPPPYGEAPAQADGGMCPKHRRAWKSGQAPPNANVATTPFCSRSRS